MTPAGPGSAPAAADRPTRPRFRPARGRWSAALVVAALVATASPAGAQVGFTSAGAERLRELEGKVVETIRADSVRAMSRTLSARPHVAGTPAQAAVRDTLVAWLERWGLDPRVATYEVFLPHARSVSIALVDPDTVTFPLGEPPVPGDPATAHPQYPWVNGYSAPGEAVGEVVYANFGLHEDYAALDSIGVDVSGRIVLARYGRSYRGVKARLAERRGAAALLLYSDPADDGFVRGDVYPDGPFRPWSGVQRGSVMNGVGDPTTPTGPSVAGAARIEPARAPNLPSIPVAPVSYEVAGRILDRVRGADLPDEAWQGGLPKRYHVGPGPGRLRIAVDDDRDGEREGMKPIHDVLARIEGREWPDELVVVGGHIDAWGAGANDNVSGTTSVWSVARALAARLEEGWRPRRTIVLAGWDAEEWGLIGSTEWVEEHAADLSEGGVAYLNQDAIGGTRFGAGASHSLAPLLREVAGAVPTAGAGSTLLDDWREASDTRLGDLGGGSDYAGFYNHLGVPSASFGFGAPGGVYHSAYDTWRWMDEFGDPGFVHHAVSARLTALLTLRLAEAEILPYDYAAYAGRAMEAWKTVRDPAGDLVGEAPVSEVDAALESFERAGRRLNVARSGYLAGAPDPAASREANAALRSVERAMTRPEGLEGRPWYRNLAFASDRRSGYATIALPSVAEAIRSGDRARVEAEVGDLAARLVEARRRLEAAITNLGR